MTVEESLRELVEQVLRDEELSDEDRTRIHSAAAGEAQRIQSEHRIAKTAHIHAVRHQTDLRLGDDGSETTDASQMVCHDCGRALISDVGLERILICPRLHGLRPPALVPKHPDGAVECGVKE